MTRLKNAKAFTLIELIVVIVIIGILVAIAAVAYNSIIANSKKSALEATGAQVSKIIQAKSASDQAVLTPAQAAALDFAGDGVKAPVKVIAGTGLVTVFNDTNANGAVNTGELKVDVTLSTIAGAANTVGSASVAP